MRALLPLLLCVALAAVGCKRERAPVVVNPLPVTAASGPVGAIETSKTGQGLRLALPSGKVEASGRTATVSLPFRASDGFVWNAPNPTPPPWRLTSSTIRKGAGPEGTDLAVFDFAAAAPGSAPLKFSLAATSGPNAPVITFSATVSAK